MDLFSDKDEIRPSFDIPEGIESSFQWDESLGAFHIQVPNGDFIFSEGFFNKKISDRSLEYFQENDSLDWKTTKWREVEDDSLDKLNFYNAEWKHDKIRMYGKMIPLPRLTSWYGDPGNNYTYSGIKSEPNPWNKGLAYIKREVEKVAKVNFNSVLLNWYRDGEDYLNWHADDEKELGVNPVIASVNFGESRDFVLRRNDDQSIKIVIPLGHGTLLIMRGETQHFWQHSVPKRKNVKGSRINLTFRNIHVKNA